MNRSGRIALRLLLGNATARLRVFQSHAVRADRIVPYPFVFIYIHHIGYCDRNRRLGGYYFFIQATERN